MKIKHTYMDNIILNNLNWSGRGRNKDIEPLFIEKRKRVTAYMMPALEIETILNKKSTRLKSNTLLIKGNT